jgi:hypothetical protein
MRKFTILLILVFQVALVYSQKGSIKGVVTDSTEKKNISYSVIALLRKTDSVLVKFTRSDKDGNFQIKSIPAGNFILRVTHPEFVDYVDQVAASSNEINLGQVFLTHKSKILEEVFVKQNVAIRIKGDTIEYKADSFKVREGATVQDLLKKLPGLQVDKNGQITAQGQKVEKVLVDGEEFFSDDPAVVTQNLRADALDKVQAFDKKSDQAEFTGIDDGVKQKTLNLVLKEDKKKGYFGKISAGVGTEKRYSDEAMLNYFKGKKKLSAYGIVSNNGKIGLDWEDRDKYGSGSDFGDATVEVGVGFISITSDGAGDDFSDFGPSFYGEGIPVIQKAGAHFSNKWKKDYYNLNGDYTFKHMNVDAHGGTLTQYILPDSVYYYKENHHNLSKQLQQNLKGYYDIKLDSISSVRIRWSGTIGNTKNNQQSNSEYENENLDPVTRNTRNNISNNDSRTGLVSALWKQRLKKAGRTFSLSASHKYNDQTSTGYLLSNTFYYDNSGQLNHTDTIDQYKEGYSRTLTTTSKLVYTEPLSKKSTLEFNYAFNRIVSESNRKSFDKLNGKYEVLNLAYSNDYELGFVSNSVGAKYQYNSKKILANIGSNIGVSNYSQKDSSGKKVRSYSYTNLFPTTRLTYKLGAQKSINFNYSGSPQSPSISQIQPIRENADPLNVVIGNPSLKQAFRHNLSLSYNNYQVLTGKSIWATLYFNPTQNAIVTSQVTDVTGKRTLQYVNAAGNYNGFGQASFSFKLKKSGINLGPNFHFNANQSVNFIQPPGYTSLLKNVTTTKNVSLGMNLYKYKDEKYDVSFSPNVSRNFSKSSISNNKSAYWMGGLYGDINYYISKKWEIGTNCNLTFREKLDAFDNNANIAEVNAEITHKFFKNNNGVLKFQVFDLLDQKKGFNRYYDSNYITEKTYDVLRRYFMLSFVWSFSKNPGEVK